MYINVDEQDFFVTLIYQISNKKPASIFYYVTFNDESFLSTSFDYICIIGSSSIDYGTYINLFERNFIDIYLFISALSFIIH